MQETGLQSSDLSQALPLTEATTLILLSLASQDRHGYAILKDVANLSQGRVELSTGTLYGALRRLLDNGWIQRVETQPDHHGPGRPRKAYTLTRTGRRVLQAELDRFQRILETAHLRGSGSQA